MDTPSRRPLPAPAATETTPALAARLEAEARGCGDPPHSPLPAATALAEALAVADFIERRWEPGEDASGVALPGLVSGAAALPRGVADELRALVTLASAAHQANARARRVSSAGLVARGRALLTVLHQAAAWVRGTGLDARVGEALDRARAARRAGGKSAEALATALDVAARVVAPYREALEGVGGFGAAALDEAAEVADALRGRAAARAAWRGDALRDAYLAMIAERVGWARAAARFVFRAHPAVVREATSAWERAKRRRRKKG